jgi:hypothetical protein
MKTTLQKMDHCAECNKQTLHVSIYTKERCNHLLHLFLSLLTSGLWIIMWFVCAACAEDSSTKPQCTICGSTDTRTEYEKSQKSQGLGSNRRAPLPWLFRNWGTVTVLVFLVALVGYIVCTQ